VRLSVRTLLITALGWALFGWLHGTQVYLAVLAEAPQAHLSYGRAVLWEIGCWLLWAAFTPLVVWMSRRVPLALRPRPIFLHFVVSVLVTLVRVAGVVLVQWLVKPFESSGGRPFFDEYMGTLSSYFHLDLLVYWAIVGVVHAFDSRQRLREREIQASRVEAQLAQAQLANLRLQLQPHFLFNTLHATASLVREGDSQAAVTMIAGLSDLLRYALDNAGRNLVPLSEELDIVQRYLEIQQTRFSDRLRVTLSIADETRDAAVPTLLLQPLVENAIRHGIAASAGAGTLAVRTRHDGGSLVIEVFNDGQPLSADWRQREGVGLSSTRVRLRQLYGERARLELEDQAPVGVVARVTLPFSRELRDD
jgi:two-component system, LytTR family, sensor kinase